MQGKENKQHRTILQGKIADTLKEKPINMTITRLVGDKVTRHNYFQSNGAVSLVPAPPQYEFSVEQHTITKIITRER